MSEKLPNINCIQSYIHCQRCLKDSGNGKYVQQLEVGRTVPGYQIWCKKHNINVLHIGITKTGEVILNSTATND